MKGLTQIDVIAVIALIVELIVIAFYLAFLIPR